MQLAQERAKVQQEEMEASMLEEQIQVDRQRWSAHLAAQEIKASAAKAAKPTQYWQDRKRSPLKGYSHHPFLPYTYLRSFHKSFLKTTYWILFDLWKHRELARITKINKWRAFENQKQEKKKEEQVESRLIAEWSALWRSARSLMCLSLPRPSMFISISGQKCIAWEITAEPWRMIQATLEDLALLSGPQNAELLLQWFWMKKLNILQHQQIYKF